MVSGGCRWQRQRRPRPGRRCACSGPAAASAPLVGSALVAFPVGLSATEAGRLGLRTVAATVPMVEPIRRDHDAPLAAELVPLGYAALQRAHVHAALRLGLAVIVPTSSVTAWLLAPGLAWWVGTASGLLGVALLALRVIGLSVWLGSAEAALADASAPEPGSSLQLAWWRLRDRRRR